MDSDLDPTTSPDVQQALSWKYTNKAVLVMPLTSGKFAIFDRGFELEAIVDAVPTASELIELSQKFTVRAHYQARLISESKFYGEPDTKTLAHDLAQARKPNPRPRPNIGIAVEISLD